MGASFQIGRSALSAYQAAISITGQNIANVANPDYARQTGRLTALRGGLVRPGVSPGGGVSLFALRRHVDEALEARLRNASASLSGAEVTHRALSQTETLYNELTGADISSQLSEFFSSFSQLQTDPSDIGLRNLVVSGADTLIRSFDRIRTEVLRQTRALNDEVVASVGQAQQLAEEVASLNELIVRQESDGATISSALRDRRDAVLRDLGAIMEIEVRELDSGAVNVFVSSEPLVQFDRSRGLVVERTLVDGLEITEVRFADNGGSVTIREGILAGVIEARDIHIRDQLDRLDRLAKGLIYEVNRVHSSGVGLVARESLTGSYAVDDPDAVLNSDAAGLPFPLHNGTFFVQVRNISTGQLQTRQIEVDLDGIGGDDTSLTDLAAALNAVPGLSARVTADFRLEVEADAGNEFYFSEDNSGALAALGMGGFFVGTSGSDIDVDPTVRADVRLIAASATGGIHDGDNAGDIARLANSTAASSLLGELSIQDFHSQMVNDLAIETSGALIEFQAADSVFAGLTAQRESISGVNLDEEAINLTRFERAYQSAARYLNVLDELSSEMLALL